MSKFRFTGNPFVDAGIAGMCAAADVASMAELDEPAMHRAVDELLRVLGSEYAFSLREQGKRRTAFASSEMSVIFPNGTHANPAVIPEVKASRYRAKLLGKLEAALGLESAVGLEAALELQGAVEVQPGSRARCFVDGSAASVRVGNDEFPLIDSRSKRNFHPGHQEGHTVSHQTLLALEFFPLSVLRTGSNAGLFWFVHTADEEIATACARLNLGKMRSLIEQKQGIDFYGEWRIASHTPHAAFVALTRDLCCNVGKNGLLGGKLAGSDFPVTAYLFSNDNRSPTVNAQEIPRDLFRYFQALQNTVHGVDRFQTEVLEDEYVCGRAAGRMIRAERIARSCSVPATGSSAARLRGGWGAHSLYLTEVMGISGKFVQVIEEVAERLTCRDMRRKVVLALSGTEPPATVLLRLVKWGVLTDQEFAFLAPPEVRDSAIIARDCLLACLFERESAPPTGHSKLTERAARTEHGASNEYSAPKDRPITAEQYGTTVCDGDRHPMLDLAERIGTELIRQQCAKHAIADLENADRVSTLRKIFRDFVRDGCATWNDFVYLFPPEFGEYKPGFSARDYLLAYLYNRRHVASRPKPASVMDDQSSLEGPTGT